MTASWFLVPNYQTNSTTLPVGYTCGQQHYSKISEMCPLCEQHGQDIYSQPWYLYPELKKELLLTACDLIFYQLKKKTTIVCLVLVLEEQAHGMKGEK